MLITCHCDARSAWDYGVGKISFLRLMTALNLFWRHRPVLCFVGSGVGLCAAG